MFNPHIPQDISALQTLFSYADYAEKTYNHIKTFFGGLFRKVKVVEPGQVNQQPLLSTVSETAAPTKSVKEQRTVTVKTEVPNKMNQKFGYKEGAKYTPQHTSQGSSKIPVSTKRSAPKADLTPASSYGSLADSKKTSTSTESLASVASSTASKGSRRSSVDSGISISSTGQEKKKGNNIAFGTKVPTNEQRIIQGKDKTTAEVTFNYDYRAKAIKK